MRLIDGDALIKYCNGNPFITDSVKTYIRISVATMPTIEERKTGKWIIEPYDAQNDIFIHRCGTCMRVAMLGGHTTKFKYCPLCGSAMEGEQP